MQKEGANLIQLHKEIGQQQWERRRKASAVSFRTPPKDIHTEGKSGLKRLWKTTKPGPALEEPLRTGPGDGSNSPVCSVLVLQVWPSQTSLREEGDGQSVPEEDAVHNPDSGIDSYQASPTPAPQSPGYAVSPCDRKSRSFLHPDHARTMSLRPPTQDRRSSLESPNSGFATSVSSSAASSTTSIAAGTVSRTSDPLQDRRRSSTVTARYSLLDALDLEYALMRVAGRGSIGPYSLSQSLQKLSFTQSLAFPALARGLADKRGKSEKSPRLDTLDSGINAFAKVATALVLVLVSVLVFGVVYKFVRT